MDDVEVAISALHGRHLKVRKSFAAGRQVVTVKPYAAVLYDDHVPKRCAYCFQPGERLLRCSKSKFAYFCNKDHHRLAWATGYKEEAEALAHCQGRIPPSTLRLCARVLWRRAKEAAAGDVSSYQEVEGLLHHWDELDDERKATYAQMAVVVRQYMQGCASAAAVAAALDVKEVALLLARFACNNHTMCDEELRPYGVGVYPFAALANHSCNPTCMQAFPQGNITFRTLKPLQPGEEVTISYIELAATRRERQENLMYLYFFDINRPLSDAACQTSCIGGLDASTTDFLPPAVDAVELRQEPSSKGAADPLKSTVASSQPVSWPLPNGFDLSWFGSSVDRPPWPCDAADAQLTQVVDLKTRRAVAGGLEVCPNAYRPVGQAPLEPAGSDEEWIFSMLSPAPRGAGRLLCWGPWTAELESVPQVAKDDGTSESSRSAEPTPILMACNVANFCQQVTEAAVQTLMAERCTQQGELAEASRLLTSAMDLADGRGSSFKLGARHLLRFRINSALMKASIDQGQNWTAALAAARALIPIFELVYPRVWPNMSLHWAAAAKLENLVGDEVKALEAAEHAAETMTVTHPDSDILLEQLHLRHDLQKSSDK